MLQGNYAHRFSGYAVADGRTWYVAGVGLMRLTLTTEKKGLIEGKQAGTTMLLTTADAVILPGDFDLSGDYGLGKDGLWRASLTFKTPGQNDLVGSFAVVDAGAGERLFLVTTQTSLKQGLKLVPTPEMTSGEAVKIDR